MARVQKKRPAAKKTLVQGPRGGRTPRVNEEPPRDLKFEQGDERSRVGEPKSRRQMRDEFPPERVREAGRTAGEMPGGEVTADDMAPETLLDEERSRTPDSARGRAPLDTALDVLDGTIVGGGIGPDEAERAQRDPVGTREAEALRRRAHAHAADANSFEPHETEELAAAERERRGKERP